jgi:hypothetical protein
MKYMALCQHPVMLLPATAAAEVIQAFSGSIAAAAADTACAVLTD